jgi:IS5 family transposase
MHQTKKGNEWRFGMKCHAGVDAGNGLVHTIEVTAANAHDINITAKLIRADDEVVYGDSGYIGIEKREEIQMDEHLSAIEYRINRRPGKPPKVSDNAIDWDHYIENRKSSTRCKVEHLFHIIKNLLGYSKAVYRGLSKNLNRLHMLCAAVFSELSAVPGCMPDAPSERGPPMLPPKPCVAPVPVSAVAVADSAPSMYSV